MTFSRQPSEIRILEPALQWAMAHPAFFFRDGVVTAESMVEGLVAGARALGAMQVEVRTFGFWHVVAANLDWFKSARFPVPEDFNFGAHTPFPELGQNCVRPECIVAAFAESVIVRGANGARIVKGEVQRNEPVLREVGNPAWQRAVAFRLHGA